MDYQKRKMAGTWFSVLAVDWILRCVLHSKMKADDSLEQLCLSKLNDWRSPANIKSSLSLSEDAVMIF